MSGRRSKRARTSRLLADLKRAADGATRVFGPSMAPGWKLSIDVTPASAPDVGPESDDMVTIRIVPDSEVPGWWMAPAPSGVWLRHAVLAQSAPPAELGPLAEASAVPYISAAFSRDGPHGALIAEVPALYVGHDVASDAEFQGTLSAARRTFERSDDEAARERCTNDIAALVAARPAQQAAAREAAYALSGQRLSSFLMAVLARIAEEVGATAIVVDSDASDIPGLYEGMGFVSDGDVGGVLQLGRGDEVTRALIKRARLGAEAYPQKLRARLDAAGGMASTEVERRVSAARPIAGIMRAAHRGGGATAAQCTRGSRSRGRSRASVAAAAAGRNSRRRRRTLRARASHRCRPRGDSRGRSSGTQTRTRKGRA